MDRQTDRVLTLAKGSTRDEEGTNAQAKYQQDLNGPETEKKTHRVTVTDATLHGVHIPPTQAKHIKLSI